MLEPRQLCDLVNYLLGMPPRCGVEPFVVRMWRRPQYESGFDRFEHWADYELQRVGLIPAWKRNPRWPGRPTRTPPEIQRFQTSRLPGFHSGGRHGAAAAVAMAVHIHQ